MATSSLLYTAPYKQIQEPVYKMLKERGVDTRGISYDARLNVYMARTAQADGNPRLSWEEAARAVEDMVAGRPAQPLPGSGQRMSYLVEDQLDLGGWHGEQRGRWESEIRDIAAKSGAEAKLEVVPGTLKPVSRLSKLFGVTDRATYRITAAGTRAQVEAFFDAYHARRVYWLDQFSA
ncbi:MAG: hypothetical protein ACAI38_09325 [Myxococcota bacterium]